MVLTKIHSHHILHSTLYSIVSQLQIPFSPLHIINYPHPSIRYPYSVAAIDSTGNLTHDLGVGGSNAQSSLLVNSKAQQKGIVYVLNVVS